MTKPVRIGNAQAFWGDRGDAAAAMLAHEPDLDYLTLDYLAEVSMSILAAQRERDREAGFAQDFVDVVRSLIPYWSSGGQCRLIANAGGLNPRGCALACKAALEAAGCRPIRIGVITGDDVLDIVRAGASSSDSQQFRNLDSGTSIKDVADRLVTANAYLGAAPIVEALAGGAEIVITGRVADPSLVVAACVHHFGWGVGRTEADRDAGAAQTGCDRDEAGDIRNRSDQADVPAEAGFARSGLQNLDRLAGATVAGHLIECGSQVTGGISTNWLDVPDPAHLAFPIVEVSDDGRCIVTKPRGTGGRVTDMTVREQLVYEIGDPANYISPDVTVSFLSLRVENLGNDRVQVSGAIGKPCTAFYKVSATFRDGFRAAGTLTIVGRHALEKARRCGEFVLQHVREAGFLLRDSIIECLGSGACAAGIVDAPGQHERDHSPDRFGEIVLRIAVEAESRDAVERFSRELMPLITAGPQGTTGYAEGRPRIHPLIRYWPCLIARDLVKPQVEWLVSQTGLQARALIEREGEAPAEPTLLGGWPGLESDSSKPRGWLCSALSSPGPPTSTLYDIACARSGDKGSSANVGLIAHSEDGWLFLRDWLTADRVAEFFAPLEPASVERFELPNLGALNFVLHGVLRRGLRTDAQGKALGQILLEMPLPDDFVRMITDGGE